MADIDVVKKGPTAWLWIVAVLVALVLIIWFVMGRGDAPRTGRLEGTTQPVSPRLISGVALHS